MERITIDIPEEYTDLYVVGDIHGEFRELVYNITNRYGIKDSVVVIAGDCGLGFEKPGHYENLYGRIKGHLEKSRVLLLGVRGNHDDPEYFGGDQRINYEYMKTLPDYSMIRMKGKELMVIGGAVSIDKDWRLEENKIQEAAGSGKRVWWPGEGPSELTDSEINKLPGRLYGVISHDAPVSFLPVIVNDGIYVSSDDQFFEVLGSREYLEKILWRCKPRHWYYGHHHASYTGDNGLTSYRGLKIQELIRVPLEEDDLPEP